MLVGDFGEIVVIDWGLAERSRRRLARLAAGDAHRARPAAPRSPTTSDEPALTVAGAVIGTPAYMPPEQARGEVVDERADVFSLGAMLYHLLAGAPPYAAKTATDVLATLRRSRARSSRSRPGRPTRRPI
ncbi:MAG: protein kinase [Myxococcales bacterium]|nr:protein kinase [Myxococcales bacterium]